MNNRTISQAEFIKEFTDEYRESFNKALFTRNDNDIIEEIQKVILSCQRDRHFTLKVHSFRVVEEYGEVINTLFQHEQNLNKNKKKKRDNPYEFVDLKDSDIKLLIVTYYIAVKEKSEYVDVIIAIPRIVNKYYFKIGGNIYSALYQVVDGSTYNNSTSNSVKHSITLKTMFMPIRIYRNLDVLKDVNDQDVRTAYYTARIFKKSFSAIKCFLAKFGLYDALSFIGVNCITITQTNPNNENVYTFLKNDNIFINVPKYLFDNDVLVQSIVYSLYHGINKECQYEDVFKTDYWICSLGGEFSNFSVDKGVSILDSLESIYDISTKESIRLPMESKETVYHVLRWMVREFSNLKSKDNLDISTKKIRYAEYIASLYATKLSLGIYRIADDGKKVTIEGVKKVICIQPTYLLSAITKCNLVNYRNMVNDLDATVALEYTYKGISGIGENNKSVPEIYRFIHTSHLGRVDIDSSPKSDPGMSGMLCPLTDLYGDSFSDYQEPNFWEHEFTQLMNNYKALIGMKEVIKFKKDVLGIEDQEAEDIVDDSINTFKQLIKPVYFVESTAEIKYYNKVLEEGGMIVYGEFGADY